MNQHPSLHGCKDQPEQSRRQTQPFASREERDIHLTSPRDVTIGSKTVPLEALIDGGALLFGSAPPVVLVQLTDVE